MERVGKVKTREVKKSVIKRSEVKEGTNKWRREKGKKKGDERRIRTEKGKSKTSPEMGGRAEDTGKGEAPPSYVNNPRSSSLLPWRLGLRVPET